MEDAMTDGVTRRNLLHATTAGAVAAAVPAVASANSQPASDPLANERIRDQAVQDLAERMPADARAWIDTARAAGSRVGLAKDSTGGEWVGRHFRGTDPEVNGFLQRWQVARLDTGEIAAELDREQPGENDRRLCELHRQWSEALAEHDRCHREASRIEAQLPWRLRRPFDGKASERIAQRFGVEAEIRLRKRANKEREPLLQAWGARDLEERAEAAIKRANECEEAMAQIVADTPGGARTQIAVLEHEREIATGRDEDAFNGDMLARMAFRVFELVQRQAGEV
jgi:hypothetical protein